ncbi:MAG: DUF4214 domain-containing protein, partial [Actinobacteria bacterium]|nr:DUF4214 domain-containing protein [Actinomycetota bacterium]
PRAGVVRIMATSAEGWGFLGEASWLKALELFELEDNRAAIETLWPTPASVFVRGLYRRLLHREPHPREWLGHMARLRSGHSRLDAVRSVTDSIETNGNGLVPNLALELSERLDRAQRDPRAAQISEAIRGDDQRFVEVAYRTVLSREPDSDGLNRAIKRMRFGVRRGQLLADLARSEEAVSQAIDPGFLLGIEGPPPGVMEIIVGGGMAVVRPILPHRVRAKARAAGRLLTRAVPPGVRVPGRGSRRRELSAHEGVVDHELRTGEERHAELSEQEESEGRGPCRRD